MKLFRNLKVTTERGLPICQTPMNPCVKDCLGCPPIPFYGCLCILAAQGCTAVTQAAVTWGNQESPCSDQARHESDAALSYALIDNGLDV